ncbi:MAG TPA: ferredoxin [Acidimicrobiales bacterium]
MRIRIDHDRCTGHGRCYSLAPDLFDCDDEGYGRPLLTEVPTPLHDQARSAVDTCPERAVLTD